MKHYQFGQPAEALETGLLLNSKVVLDRFSFLSKLCLLMAEVCFYGKTVYYKSAGEQFIIQRQSSNLYVSPKSFVCLQLCILPVHVKWGNIDFSCILTRC